MKNSFKIYWRVTLGWLGVLLLLYALAIALAYERENTLSSVTNRDALERELGIGLPDYWEILMENDYDGYKVYTLYFKEPLSSEQMRLIEERCDDPLNGCWERDNLYAYDRKNFVWGYDVQCYIRSSEEMMVAVWDYSLTSSFSLYAIPLYLLVFGLLGWIAVIPLWGLVLLVMALVHRGKQPKVGA